jgi:hypothetical protein
MEFERLEALVQAGVLSFVSILITVVFIMLARRAANGRLQRNQWIGIRTPSTLRSDRGWMAGHRAALRLTPLFLLTTVAMCVALFAVALYASTPGVVRPVGFGVIVVIIALVIYSAFVAGNAAKSADVHTDEWPTIGPNQRRRNGRFIMNIESTANAQYGRIVLVSYAALNGALLILVCAVLWFFAARANSDAIAPNTSLGFRSQHTLASLHGWYVAQRAGFHFAVVADTIVTVAVFAIVAWAFIRHLNPMWILITPIIGGIAIVMCLVIAGQKADHAAIRSKSTVSPAAEAMG